MSFLAVILVAACERPGELGDACERASDCGDGLQCFSDVCQARCTRLTDCGDGHVCQEGACVAAPVQRGGACQREIDCAAGLACQLGDTDVDGDGRLDATCRADQSGNGLDLPCLADQDCRNGTCALGRCIDLCAGDLDCPSDHVCATIPRPTRASSAPAFGGCLPDRGIIAWTLPTDGPRSELTVPVPSNARSVSLLIAGTDPQQPVGMTRMAAPTGLLYAQPATLAEFYANRVRHRPAPRISVVQLPFDDSPLITGAYAVTISSFRPNGTMGTTTPRVIAYAKLDDGARLDVHFYFLDLGEHPCAERFDGGVLDAASAKTSPHFQNELLGGLRGLLGTAGIAVGTVTYDDLRDQHDLDGIELRDLDTLLSQSTRPGGVQVFIVRSLSPAGLVALLGRAPGVPGVAGTPASGIALSADALCYRTWPQVTRVLAHEIARYLGVPRTVEPDGGKDILADTPDDHANLLHYADRGGTALTDTQKRMLRRSGALR